MSASPIATQLGDATVHRCLGNGLLGMESVHLMVHQAHRGAMKINIASGNPGEARIETHQLPELIQTLIARSGRTDLTLHQGQPSDDGVHVKVTVPADADAIRTPQALTKAAVKGTV